jgi:hypothetical protein
MPVATGPVAVVSRPGAAPEPGFGEGKRGGGMIGRSKTSYVRCSMEMRQGSAS